MDEQDWLTWRDGGIGASDVAQAESGMYGGAFDVVAKKLKIKSSSIDPAVAARGKKWEQPIADAVHKLTGYYVVGEQLLVEHDEYPRWRATLDGLLSVTPATTLADADALIEIKTRSPYARKPWEYYHSQVQWQMSVTGHELALLAVGTIGLDADGDEIVSNLDLTWISRDDAMIERLRSTADSLLRAIDTKRMPGPDEATLLADVKEVHRRADLTADAVNLDEHADAIDDYQSKKWDAKTATEAYRAAEVVLRAAIGDATDGYTSTGYRVKVGAPVRRFTRDSEARALVEFPDYGRPALDRERFKSDQPDAYESLKSESSDRRLTIKPPEDETE